MGPTHPKPEFKHGSADAVDLLSLAFEAVQQNMNGSFVRKEQAAAKIIGFGLHPSIVKALPGVVQRRGTLVTKETMRKFVADVAALAMGVVRVVVDDGCLKATGHRHRRERAFRAVQEQRTVAGKIAQSYELNIEIFANSIDVERINGRKSHLPPNIQRDPVRFCFEAPLKRQL